jgi:hypothetical protein
MELQSQGKLDNALILEMIMFCRLQHMTCRGGESGVRFTTESWCITKCYAGGGGYPRIRCLSQTG